MSAVAPELLRQQVRQRSADSAPGRLGRRRDLEPRDQLSADEPAVLSEMTRVLKPGGRIGITEVVAEGHLRAEHELADGMHGPIVRAARARAR